MSQPTGDPVVERLAELPQEVAALMIAQTVYEEDADLVIGRTGGHNRDLRLLPRAPLQSHRHDYW